MTLRERKIEVIRSINQKLIDLREGQVTTEDFDELYDMDIDQLVNTEFRIQEMVEQFWKRHKKKPSFS